MTGEKPGRRQAFGTALCLLVVLGVAFWHTYPYFLDLWKDWNRVGRPSWQVPPGQTVVEAGADIDTVLIHGGLERAPRFRDTLRWWSGVWVGQNQFYRPLSSLLFWCEWKLLGDREMRYALFALLLHLAAVTQLTRMAQDFYRHFGLPWASFAALLAGLLFVDSLWILPGQRSACLQVFRFWKNQPDSLCLLCLCLSLRAYLRALPSRSAPPAKTGGENVPCVGSSSPPLSPSVECEGRRRERRALGRAIVWYLAACAAKEVGIGLPLLLIALEADALRSGVAERVQAAKRRLLPLFLSMVLFWLWRSVCLGTLAGYHYGSNEAWWYRALSGLFGPVSQAVMLQRWNLLALGLVLAWRLWRLGVSPSPTGRRKGRAWKRVLAEAGGVLLLLIVASLPEVTTSDPLLERVVIALWQYLDAGMLTGAIGIALFLVGVIVAWRFSWQIGLFCVLWVLTNQALIAASTGPMHRYYLLGGGFALWVGAGLALWAGAAWQRQNRHKTG